MRTELDSIDCAVVASDVIGLLDVYSIIRNPQVSNFDEAAVETCCQYESGKRIARLRRNLKLLKKRSLPLKSKV